MKKVTAVRQYGPIASALLLSLAITYCSVNPDLGRDYTEENWKTLSTQSSNEHITGVTVHSGYACTDQGVIYTYTDHALNELYRASAPLNDITVSRGTTQWAAGRSGLLVEISSASQQEHTVTSLNINAVWANEPNDVWVVGDNGAVLHYDGQYWTEETLGTGRHNDVWAVGDQVWIASEKGHIWRRENNEWQSTVLDTPASLNAVSGVNHNNVWLVGDNGTIVHWDGMDWSYAEPVTSENLNDLLVYKSAADVDGDTFAWAAGDNGTILRWDTTIMLPDDTEKIERFDIEQAQGLTIRAISQKTDHVLDTDTLWFGSSKGRLVIYEAQLVSVN